MTRRFYLRIALAAATGFSTGFAVIALLQPQPRLIWNASASAPIGLYAIGSGGKPAVGDLVAVIPPPAVARFLAQRGYLPEGLPLIKRVAAAPGQTICRFDIYLSVDGRVVAKARKRDRAGRQLPVWYGCHRLGARELLLVNAAPDSLDSRYFGPIAADGLIGIARPLLIRTARGAPLRWRPALPPCHPPQEKPSC